MKCPYCERDAQVKDYVKHNILNYGKPVRARTDCCGKIIVVSMKPTYYASESTKQDKDDWGQ